MDEPEMLAHFVERVQEPKHPDHVQGWRHVARGTYGDWGTAPFIDTYISNLTPGADGNYTLTLDELRDLLTSAWIDGKED